MKKLLFGFAAFLSCICATVKAQTISVEDVEVLPGTTGSFTLNLQGGQDNKYISLQFNATFPKTGFKTLSKNDISPLWVGASATIGDIDADGLAIIPMSSDTELSTGNVEGLLTVYFEVADNVAKGTYPVTLSKITFGYGISDKDVAKDVTFNVKVVDHVTLFETATKAPDPMENVKVLVKRNFAKDTWSTICLPFAMTEAQTKTAFGDGVVIGDYAGYEAKTEGKQVVGVTVKFTQKTSIEANHPYVIKPSKAVDGGFIVEGVNINPAKEDDLVVAAVERSKKDWSEMIGTFIAGTSVSKDALFLNGGKFWYSKGKNTMLAYRAYFDFYDVLTEVENASSRINISFDDVTAIKSVKTNEDEGIYTLSGQRVNKAGKGIYIVNGKKVIKK